MTPLQGIWLAAALLGVGLWLLLPRRSRRGRYLAIALIIAAGVVLSLKLFSIGGWGRNTIFVTLAAIAVASGIGTVTMRSPVYCALWFAMSLLGTAGLFLFIGAQFLGIATIVVYAGAIVVTFLFVLMLAQPEGHAFYDRISWQAPVSAFAGALMVGILTTIVGGVFFSEGNIVAVSSLHAEGDLADEILAEHHVAAVGARLFGEHLIAVQVAGILLMVALIGAAAMIAQRPKPQPQTLRGRGQDVGEFGSAGGSRL